MLCKLTTSYILSASNQFGCSTKDTVKLTVEDYFLMTLEIKGPQAACRGIENIYSAEGNNAGELAIVKAARSHHYDHVYTLLSLGYEYELADTELARQAAELLDRLALLGDLYKQTLVTG
jgi:hypothetical protein